MATYTYDEKTGILGIFVPVNGPRRESSTKKTMLVSTGTEKTAISGEELRVQVNITVPNIPANR